jgi:adenylate cyclase
MPLDESNLKGFNHPVLAVEILRWREEAEAEDVAAAAAEAPRRRKQPL